MLLEPVLSSNMLQMMINANNGNIRSPIFLGLPNTDDSRTPRNLPSSLNDLVGSLCERNVRRCTPLAAQVQFEILKTKSTSLSSFLADAAYLPYAFCSSDGEFIWLCLV